jgi:hypothetical protein
MVGCRCQAPGRSARLPARPIFHWNVMVLWEGSGGARGTPAAKNRRAVVRSEEAARGQGYGDCCGAKE